MRPLLYSATIFAVANCRCPEPKEPAPPKAVEVVLPCKVAPPEIPLTDEDFPDPNADGSVTIKKESFIRIAQSILAWKNYVSLTIAKCSDKIETPSNVASLPVQ